MQGQCLQVECKNKCDMITNMPVRTCLSILLRKRTMRYGTK
jgi:hypothetical protein